MSRIDAGSRGVPRAPSREAEGGGGSAGGETRRGRRGRARGGGGSESRRGDGRGAGRPGSEGREEVAGLTPMALGAGVGGVVVTVVGLVLIARGDITAAPILLVLAYLVLFPLALSR